MYNEDKSLVTRDLIETMNKSFVLEIAGEELRGI